MATYPSPYSYLRAEGGIPVTPPNATSETVISGGSVSSWTFGAFTDPVGRIASYSATLVTVTGSGSLSGSGLGPYSITGTADGDAYTVELDALDGDGGVLATAVHTVTIEGEGLADPTVSVSAGDYMIGGYHDLDGVDEGIDFGAVAPAQLQYADTFSISFWMEGTNTADADLFVGYISATGGNLIDRTGWCVYQTSTVMRFFIGENGSFYKYVTPNMNPLAGWHHYLLVWNAGTMSAYRDGASVTFGQQGSNGTPSSIAYTAETLVIGNKASIGTFGYPEAYLAEVAIWSSDQSANVAAIYNSRARHNLMDLATPPDVFYAPLTSYGDDPDPATTGGVFEAVAGNNGTGVNMETADAVIPTVTEISSTLTKAINVSTSVVMTTKVENVITGTSGGTGSSFP